jgi:type I restriction enzyme S subunit
LIDTNVIRDKVLSLAVNGKLVKQDFTEESADILISRINEDLHGQIHAETWKKDEIPFEIPTNWSWCRLSDIGYTNIGLTYHPQDIVKDGIIVIRSSNIINGEIDYTDLVKVNCPIRKNQYLNRNDIVICVRNGSKALVGKCAIFKETSRKVAFGAFMAIFRTPCYRYVYHYLNTQLFRRYFNSDDTKQINQITQKILKNALIPLPPQNEQNRIVDKIEEIFSVLDTIDEYQSQYLFNVETLRNKLFDAAIQGKLSEQRLEDGTAEELYTKLQAEKTVLMQEGKAKKEKVLPEIAETEIPFDIPPNWKWVRLGDISVKISSGNTPAGGNKSNVYVEKGYSFFREQNIYNDGIHEEGLVYITEELLKTRENSTVMPMDILLNITGGSIGRCALVPDDFRKGSINQHILIVRMIDPRLRFYVHTCICSPYIQKYIKGTPLYNFYK